MADSIELVAQPRQGHGSGEARRLRRKGLIPAVLYGHKEATLSIALLAEDLEKALRHGAQVVDVKTGGKVEKALIREAQWDHLGRELLHVDFARVGADERVKVTVPVELRGQSPGVTGGGVLDQPMHTLEIECLALRIPEHIRVAIGEMQIGSVIHVRQLTLPEGVKVLADPEAIVVQVKAPVAEAAAPAVPGAEAGETAEPEVIGRKAAEKEEEGE
jgi:large subunit ribosomal protein L25